MNQQLRKMLSERYVLNYDDVRDFYKGLVRVKLDGKWGFVNRTGKEIAPLKYDGVYGLFPSSRVKVRLDDKWGYIDKDGNEHFD